MFESILTEVLNRVLGTYIENLDSSKLNISIWKGNVELKNLEIRQSALNDLDLPFQPIFGHLDNLTLKIPWSKLYSDKWVAEVKGLLLIIAPNTSIVYDSDREEKALQEAKKAALDKIEAAKNKSIVKYEKDVQTKEQEGFIEKLVAQIIRNLELLIESVHIRYEDCISCLENPFNCGIILHRLSLKSTDSSWNECLDYAKLVYKVMALDNFSIYWESHSVMTSKSLNTKEEKHKFLMDFIYNEQNLKLISLFGPINSSVRLQLNSRPDLDGEKFSIPKISLKLRIEELIIGLSRYQYQDIMNFLDAIDRLRVSSQYRKYRPSASGVKGHARQWWQYAIKCKLEGIHQSRIQWTWQHIHSHRQILKKYKSIYKMKLKGQKLSSDQVTLLANIEKQLNVFNITLARKQSEMEEERKNMQPVKAQKSGWFSWWYASSNQPEEIDSEDKLSTTNIVKKFENSLSADEKLVLYEAIGYTQNVLPVELPKNYVDLSFSFELNSLKFNIVDELYNNSVVLNLLLHNVHCDFKRRSSAMAAKYEMTVESLQILGLSQGNYLPTIATSENDKQDMPFIDVLFEVKPLSSHCDKCIRISVMPLEIKYDALSFIRAVSIFTLPQNVSLQQLQAKALNQLEVVKEKSMLGLQSVIDSHDILDLNIHIHSSKIVFPEGGKFYKNCSVAVLNLGALNMYSVLRERNTNVADLLSGGRSPDEVFDYIRHSSYDHFVIKIFDIQALIAYEGENWLNVLKSKEVSSSHLLCPMELQVDLFKCLVTSDPLLPRIKISATLPEIAFSVIDSRLLHFVYVMSSFPLMFSSETSQMEVMYEETDINMNVTDEIALMQLESAEYKEKEFKDTPQFIELDLKFTLQEVRIQIKKNKEYGCIPLLCLSSNDIKFNFIKKTFQMALELEVGDISLNYLEGGMLPIIKTVHNSETGSHRLFIMKFEHVMAKSPLFETMHKAIVNNAYFNVTNICLHLEQNALLDLIAFGDNLNKKLKQISPEDKLLHSSHQYERSTSRTEKYVHQVKYKVIQTKRKHENVIALCINAELQQVSVIMSFKLCDIATLSIEGLSVGATVNRGSTSFTSKLISFTVFDTSSTALHKKIVEVCEQEAWNANLTIFDSLGDEDYYDVNHSNISINLNLGRAKIIFLNKFIVDCLTWINTFQVAKEGLTQAGYAAAEAAKANFKDVYSHSTKVKMNIFLKAPIIYVPESSRTESGFLIDLGSLLLNNEFVTDFPENNFGNVAVFDIIFIFLTDMKMMQVNTKDFDVADSEYCIIKPISLSCKITHNMSSTWFVSKPEIDFFMKLNAVEIKLTQGDIELFFSVLEHNLNEISKNRELSDLSTINREEVVLLTSESTALELLKPELKHIKFRFFFEVEALFMNLNMNKNLEEEVTFAFLSLQRMQINSEIYSDTSLTLNATLYDCVLKDAREGESDVAIKTLLRRCEDSEFSSMIACNIQRDSLGNTLATLQVSGFSIIVCISYLLSVQSFFLDSMFKNENIDQSDNKKFEQSPSNLEKLQEQSFVQKRMELGHTKADKNGIIIKIKLEKPEIIFIETMTTQESSCIIMNAEVDSEIRITGKNRNVHACVGNLQMYSCCYALNQRHETLSQEFTYQFILAGTVELLCNILSSLTTSDKPNSDIVLVEKDYSDLWDEKDIDVEIFPFLKVETGVEACLETFHPLELKEFFGNEELFVELDGLIINFEVGSETNTFPLLKMQTAASATVTGFFSSECTVNGLVKLEIAYYNSKLAVWEPLLEPVECETTQDGPDYRSWEIAFEGYLLKNETSACTPSISEDSTDSDMETLPLIPKPLFSLSFCAKDPMEITVTKSFLDVLKILLETFTDAVNRKLTRYDGPCVPYRLCNKTGVLMIIALEKSGFQIVSTSKKLSSIAVATDEQVDLFDHQSCSFQHMRKSSLVIECQVKQERNISIELPDMGCKCWISVTKADKRYFSIINKAKNNEKWGLVASVSVFNGCKTITVSSCVQVDNHLNVCVDIYYMSEAGNELQYVEAVNPGESVLLPLHAVYTASAELFFAISKYSVCIKPLIWKSLQNYPEYSEVLSCTSRSSAASPVFHFHAVCNIEHIFWEDTLRHTLDSAMYTINLYPCALLTNLLPVSLMVEIPGANDVTIIPPGSSFHLYHAVLGSMLLQIKVLNYCGSDWLFEKTMEGVPPEWSVWSFEKVGKRDTSYIQTLELGMHMFNTKESVILSIYSPFWMVNKTGLTLKYKVYGAESVIVHQKDDDSVILFSFKQKLFFGKKKVNLKVESSEWSDKFAIDAVGSNGCISCYSDECVYQIGIYIQLSSSGLSKIVTFVPFYQIANKASHDIEICEVIKANIWTVVASGKCIGWWPKNVTKCGLFARIMGLNDYTSCICVSRSCTALYELNNKYGGILVCVSLSEECTLISLDQYLEGSTTVLILNLLPLSSIIFWQEGHENKKRKLRTQKMIHFTWDSIQDNRKFIWSSVGGKPVSLSLDMEGEGRCDTSGGWVTWLHGPQRCLMISNNLCLLDAAINSIEMERVQQEIEFSFSSIGLSLVNDYKVKEIMYMGLVSSGVVWEHRKRGGKKLRPFTQDLTYKMEKMYQLYQNQKKMSINVSSYFVIENNYEVDFEEMIIKKPFNRHLKRTFQPGFWFQVKNSKSSRTVHTKLNRVQIDNQLFDVIFPVVLAPFPQPKSILATTVPKPFIEMSVIQHFRSPDFIEYKYFKLLVQEFDVRIEVPFVSEIFEVLYPEEEKTTAYAVGNFVKDQAIVQQTLTSQLSRKGMKSQRKDFYSLLHLSPIKMHLSFSLTGLDSGSNIPVGGQVIHLFLQSIGVTLTEVQGVVFRLAFYEIINGWMSFDQMLEDVMRHYSSQVIKQLYVLVLGLDVIGNPFGLVLGVTKGFGDLFYEPIQGAVEGPTEFAEGLFYGMKSFMGKTVGGAAGAFSRIAGTLGKGVASLTLDEEYQKRRREALLNKPTDGLESFARGSKGIVTGVLDGFTGVFTKPIEGAMEEGVEGFFKGVGKGVVGLVTRPTSGFIDFASGSLDAVKRATDSNEETVRQRNPRFISSSGIISPYSKFSAMGALFLREFEKGKFAKTDIYASHVVVDFKTIVLATDRRIFLATHNDILNTWKIDWLHGYDELTEPPYLTSRGLLFSIREEKKKMFGLFGTASNSKEILISDNPSVRSSQSVCRPLANFGSSLTRMLSLPVFREENLLIFGNSNKDIRFGCQSYYKTVKVIRKLPVEARRNCYEWFLKTIKEAYSKYRTEL